MILLLLLDGDSEDSIGTTLPKKFLEQTRQPKKDPKLEWEW